MTPYDVPQVERCTNGKLLCVPCPSGHVDKSRQSFHKTFFMGLRKKPGVEVEEVIDIRVATQEFKEETLNKFSFWTPGMDINVSHVLKKQLPSYVFSDEYRTRSQSSKSTNQQHLNKRKQNSEMVDVKNRVQENKRGRSESDGLAKEEDPSLFQNALLKEVEVSEIFLNSLLIYCFGLFFYQLLLLTFPFPCSVAYES